MFCHQFIDIKSLLLANKLNSGASVLTGNVAFAMLALNGAVTGVTGWSKHNVVCGHS